jgi:hypothetical protein
VVVFLLIAVIGLSAGLGVSQRDLGQVKGDLRAAQDALSAGRYEHSSAGPLPKVNRIQCADEPGCVAELDYDIRTSGSIPHGDDG